MPHEKLAGSPRAILSYYTGTQHGLTHYLLLPACHPAAPAVVCSFSRTDTTSLAWRTTLPVLNGHAVFWTATRAGTSLAPPTTGTALPCPPALPGLFLYTHLPLHGGSAHPAAHHLRTGVPRSRPSPTSNHTAAPSWATTCPCAHFGATPTLAWTHGSGDGRGDRFSPACSGP